MRAAKASGPSSNGMTPLSPFGEGWADATRPSLVAAEASTALVMVRPSSEGGLYTPCAIASAATARTPVRPTFRSTATLRHRNGNAGAAPLRPAAGHPDVGAGDVAGPVAHQPGDRLGDLLRLAGPAHRDLRDVRLDRLGA